MTHQFSALDYAIFAVYLAASVSVGLLSARGQKSLGDYFLAGRGMSSMMIGLSILAGLFSGITYLAGPAEVYKNGFAFTYSIIAFFIATPFTTLYILPWFFRARYFTAYQFLEERFALPARLLASGLFILRVLLWLAAAIYAPALALEKVTGIPLWITILATGALTTLYTALGGMRAVIWTDVLQLVVLFGGQLLITLVAVGKIPGGFGAVWDTALADNRMDLSFSFSLSERTTFWGILVAASFLYLVQMATDQVSVQRYLTAGSLKDAQRSLWLKLWFILPVLILFYGTGLVLYAFYKIHGDPMAAGHIAKEDQILPYFVVTQLPSGLPGLLIAAIYAASMSTISAGLNSLASATVVDFQQRLSRAPERDASSQVKGAKLITVGYGVLVMALAFAVSRIPGNLVESVNTIIGLVGGPLLGLFFLGMFTRKATSRGALRGCCASFASVLALYLYQTGFFTPEKPPPVVSFIWFTLIGCSITVAVGLLASGKSPDEEKPSEA